MALALARMLAWTLLFSGWLVLGALGRMHLPLWAGGLMPLALWLGVAGWASHAGRAVPLSGRTLRTMILLLGLSTAGALAWAEFGGGGVAVCAAAVLWGLLLVSASRAARLLPSASASRGCHCALYAGALPMATPFPWREPMAWGAYCARWTMLPMMATLGAMAQWCGGDGGITPTQWVGLHLGAMLAAPLLAASMAVWSRPSMAPLPSPCNRWSTAPHRVPLPTAALAAGLVLMAWMPGLRGLMAMSICSSVAWGLAWNTPSRSGARRAEASEVAHRAPREAPSTPSLLATLTPALVVLALGQALADYGPPALEALQAALALIAIAGTLIAQCQASFATLERRF
jgi:hypothetical protein